MLTRRGFLWLCGASGAGIYLAGAGLFELPKRMVLKLAGQCSFCGKERREVFGMAGVVGREARICDECVGLCYDIIGKDAAMERVQGPPPAPRPPNPPSDELERLLRQAAAKAGRDADE